MEISQRMGKVIEAAKKLAKVKRERRQQSPSGPQPTPASPPKGKQ
jgi:hypothetical protein